MDGVMKQDGYNPDNLSQKQLWGLALSGILAEANGGRHDTLYGSKANEENTETFRRLMSRDWSIRTRKDLDRTFTEFPASNPLFLHVRDVLETMSAPARREYISSEKDRDRHNYVRLTIVNASLGRWSPNGILAWDWGRVVMLCRWAALIGLYTDEEAWEHIMVAARNIRPAYGDWYHYGLHYIAGRQFCFANLSVDHVNLQMSRMKQLMTSGAWKTIPWNTNLE